MMRLKYAGSLAIAAMVSVCGGSMMAQQASGNAAANAVEAGRHDAAAPRGSSERREGR